MKKYIKKNILNIAWFGQGDFGDDAMAYVLRLFFKKYVNINSITYYQQGRYPFFRGQDDLDIFSLYKFEIKRIIRFLLDKYFLRKFNVLLIGGGSILHSRSSIKWKLEIVRKMKKSNKNLFIACVGVSSPPQEEKFKKIFSQLINEVDVFITRDIYSSKFARDLSYKQNIYDSIDSSLLISSLCKKEFSDIMKEKRESNLVGLMFIKNCSKISEFEKKKYFEKYLSIINYILKKGKKIILFTLYIGDSYNDLELNKLLKSSSDSPEMIEIHNFDGDIFRTIKAINRCESIISMRLHGIIFSYLLGIPFISLEYDMKNSNFCSTINYSPDLCFKFKHLDTLQSIFPAIDLLFDDGLRFIRDCLPTEEANKLVRHNYDILINKLNAI